jgi:hypothetical protein
VKINSDFRDLLRNLNAAGVSYLVVGGYAVMVHTEPRYTKDLDLWIKPELNNAQALLAALFEFGAPVAGVTPEDFTEPEVFFQIGVDPVRVDILTSVLGLEFDEAWERKIEVSSAMSKPRYFAGKIFSPPRWPRAGPATELMHATFAGPQENKRGATKSSPENSS